MKVHLKHFASAFLAALLVSAAPMPALAEVSLSINIAPPELPVYEQPVAPGEDYIWTPGYWAWGDGEYYWVPGTWARPPRVGFLWTPGYWLMDGGFFVFRHGYWGSHVGYYGGVNYGYGYGGDGYQGGRWDHGHFFYNRAVNNIDVTRIHNVYNEHVVNEVTTNRMSYTRNEGRATGGNAPVRPEEGAARQEGAARAGGAANEEAAKEGAAKEGAARQQAQEAEKVHEEQLDATAEQQKHEQLARSRQDLRQSVNHGVPPIAATPRPGAFEDRGVVRAKPVPQEHAGQEHPGSAGNQGRNEGKPEQQRDQHEPPGHQE